MSNGHRYVFASLAALVVLFFATAAFGQEVHRYGTQSSGSSDGGGNSGGGGQNQRMVYPGQPMPQQNQGSGNSANRSNEQSKEEGGAEEMTSYQIRMHDPNQALGNTGQNQRGDQGSANPNGGSGEIYKGVVPGERDEVDHLKEERESGSSPPAPNKLTWLGFQPKKDKTRIFIQAARTPSYTVSRDDEGKTVVVTLDNTEVSARNFQRYIDASYFDRAVKRIETEPTSGNAVDIRIELDESMSPSVESEKDYLYVDFPHESSSSNESSESTE